MQVCYDEDMAKFYGAPLKKHTPKFQGVMREKKEKHSKQEEAFYKVYATYPKTERELDEFLKWKSGEKGFCTK